jgi:hypothetical protein
MIFLRYNYDGQERSGIVSVKFNSNIEEDRLNYSSKDNGDYIQKYLEANPSVLHKMDNLMNN